MQAFQRASWSGRALSRWAGVVQESEEVPARIRGPLRRLQPSLPRVESDLGCVLRASGHSNTPWNPRVEPSGRPQSPLLEWIRPTSALYGPRAGGSSPSSQMPPRGGLLPIGAGGGKNGQPAHRKQPTRLGALRPESPDTPNKAVNARRASLPSRPW